MQIKLFTVSIGDEGSQQDELNAFLRGHKVLDVSQHIVQNERGAYWCFCVRYIEGTPAVAPTRNLQFKEKVDYKQVLDEELSALAQLPELTAKTMQTVKGVGEKKIERYAERFLNALNT